MRPENFDIQGVIDSLVGTATTIENHLPESMSWEDLTTEDHAAIDDAIFLCDGCGWWCSNDELDESESPVLLCRDCGPGTED